tara:strand:+ start:189 stop:467 length:279 start_codon:yes stop_codon:yes gene_type:complete
MNTAGIALYNVATIAALAEIAIAGKRASPSFEMELPIWADIGICPLTYIDVIIICGPQPGIKPISIAIKGKNGPNNINDSKMAPLVERFINS